MADAEQSKLFCPMFLISVSDDCMKMIALQVPRSEPDIQPIDTFDALV